MSLKNSINQMFKKAQEMLTPKPLTDEEREKKLKQKYYELREWELKAGIEQQKTRYEQARSKGNSFRRTENPFKSNLIREGGGDSVWAKSSINMPSWEPKSVFDGPSMFKRDKK